MVTRERDPRDVRALAVSLSAKGRRTRARAERIPPAILDRLDMSLDDLEELRDGLTRDRGQPGGLTRVWYARQSRAGRVRTTPPASSAG